jgi:hypothetical protein
LTEPTRKLATIVALDVAGYSARTTAEVAALRKVIEGIAGKRFICEWQMFRPSRRGSPQSRRS